MKEYEELGHISEDKTASINDGYFLPHHSVVKKSSLTTKLRVVFDASAKRSSGLSLNDVLMTGPNIQDDLFSILIRLRSHTYAITADIEKMYRQIEIYPTERKYQKILWRENPTEPVRVFTLNTITYGTSSASFLATRSFIQLANDEVNLFPLASITLREDFYMDDLVSGTKIIDEAKALVKELIKVTRRCGIVSNHPSLIAAVDKENDNPYFCLNFGDTAKTLGVYWNPNPDSLTYTVHHLNTHITVTKRTMLSEIAQLFDPLGLLGPVILIANIMMQSLWQLKTDWDESVPLQTHTAWIDYLKQLPFLNTVNIP